MVEMKSFWAVFVEKGNLTMSIDEVIKRAVDGFKRGVPIEFDLKLT